MRSRLPGQAFGLAWWSTIVVTPDRTQSTRPTSALTSTSSASSRLSRRHQSRSRIWTKFRAGSPGTPMPRASDE
jgi:hypothetical protein